MSHNQHGEVIKTMKMMTTITLLSTVEEACATNSNNTWWMVNLTLEELAVSLKIDTGSDVNILLVSDYKTMKRKPELKPTKIRLTLYTCDRVPIMGKADITVKRKGSLHKLYFIIKPRNIQPILGKDTCDKLNLISHVNAIQNLDKNNVSACAELFTGIGCLPRQVHIKLAHNAVPIIEA